MLEFYISFARILLAICLGGIIGIERERNHKPAGMRTHMLVAMGSCLFTLSSISLGTDPARIAASIVTGIGFIGAGTIIGERSNKIVGITTAASLWTTAGIGMLAGIGEYPIAVAASFAVLFILLFDFVVKKLV
ncbi:MAG: MgtC/SapB family protein [Candidatus Aenigmarchaeota archaeon]|nr:MgtC/SapB family protein [Candidatus Aenigmarchaeota archaeon]